MAREFGADLGGMGSHPTLSRFGQTAQANSWTSKTKSALGLPARAPSPDVLGLCAGRTRPVGDEQKICPMREARAYQGRACAAERYGAIGRAGRRRRLSRQLSREPASSRCVGLHSCTILRPRFRRYAVMRARRPHASMTIRMAFVRSTVLIAVSDYAPRVTLLPNFRLPHWVRAMNTDMRFSINNQ